MNKLQILIVLVLTTFACQHYPLKDNVYAEELSKPNIVIIFTDDQGYQDLGSYGSPNIKTPHLDDLANHGIRLTDFYSAQAVCSAARAALLTGCYPNRVGISGALFPYSKKGLNTSETTIAEMLKLNGYATGAFGKWHLGDHPEVLPTKHGFDEFFGTPYSNDMWPVDYDGNQVDSTHRKIRFPQLPLIQNQTKIKEIKTLADQDRITTQLTEAAVDFINRQKHNPFFLYFPHPMPHVPLGVSDKFRGKSKQGLYGDVIMEIDWSVGQIIGALRKNKIDQNTLIIFTSDNGPWLSFGNHAGSALPLREGKGTALEGGQRVPCIVSYPSKIKPNQVLSIPMMTIDLLPTISQITGAQLPQNKIDGKSVWDIWRGKSNQNPQEAYFFYYKTNELHGVRYKNWKMYFPHRYRTLNGRKGGTKGHQVPYEQTTFKEIELYDLSKDIGETKNCAEEHPQIVAHIAALADKKRVELGDQLYKIKGNEIRPAQTVNWSEIQHK